MKRAGLALTDLRYLRQQTILRDSGNDKRRTTRREQMPSALLPNSDIAQRIRHFVFVPTCDIECAGRPKEKAAPKAASLFKSDVAN
jgi:hypothetical protein